MIQPRMPRGCAGTSTAQEFQFGDFKLDQSSYRLQRGDRVLRLEKRPMELLIFLVERRGQLVSREEIAERLWGRDVFLDVDNGINTAIRKVRTVLRDDPEHPRFVETVVGKGYRFAAPVVISTNGKSDSPVGAVQVEVAPTPAASSQQERAAVAKRPWLLLGAAAGIVLIGIVVALIRGRSINLGNQPAIKSLAVLPLKNLSGDPAQEFLADGMTEELIGRLSMISGLRVISRTSVMRFKDARQSVPEIAKALNVDGIVEGSVMREGSRVRVHAQLIRAANDEHFWSESYDREIGDVLALESEVAQSIAEKVHATMRGQEHSRLVGARYVSPEVYENYLKGAFSKGNSRAEVEESIGYFEAAIKKDPSFAPAYLGLAGAYDELASVAKGSPPEQARAKVVSAARKALELEPGLADAYVLLADIDEQEFRWAEAEAGYKRALELNPSSAPAHLELAGWLLCQGRTDEAISWSRRARELDPLGVSGVGIGWILFQSRRYDESIRELQGALAVHPDDAIAHWFLGFALIANGHPEQAIPELERARSLSDDSSAIIGVEIRALAHAGRRAEALRLLDELKRRQKKDYVPTGAFVNAYLGLGDNEQAFIWLERAYQEKSNILKWLKVHPYFDPLRGDPRFTDLIRRVGLPQ